MALARCLLLVAFVAALPGCAGLGAPPVETARRTSTATSDLAACARGSGAACDALEATLDAVAGAGRGRARGHAVALLVARATEAGAFGDEAQRCREGDAAACDRCLEAAFDAVADGTAPRTLAERDLARALEPVDEADEPAPEVRLVSSTPSRR